MIAKKVWLKRKAAFFLVLAVFISAAPFPLSAQESEEPYIPIRILGDDMLIINGGLFIPLFFQSLSGATASTQLSLGGVGSLQWSKYLNNDMAIGMEGGGMFAFSPNNRNLFMLPITIRYSYLLRLHPFDFPLSFAAGVNFVRLGSNFQIFPIVKPGISIYWNYSAEWAFGINAVYWWTMDYHKGPNPPNSESRFGNFLELSLSARYHF
jgi:hypothetical protein